MTLEIGSFTKSTTGNATVILNNAGVPDKLTFKVGKKSSSDSQNHLSWGTCNPNLDMEYSSNASSGSNDKTERGLDKVIKHYEWSGSAWVLKVEATVTDVDDGEFTLNFTQADVNYPITVLSEVS